MLYFILYIWGGQTQFVCLFLNESTVQLWARNFPERHRAMEIAWWRAVEVLILRNENRYGVINSKTLKTEVFEMLTKLYILNLILENIRLRYKFKLYWRNLDWVINSNEVLCSNHEALIWSEIGEEEECFLSTFYKTKKRYKSRCFFSAHAFGTRENILGALIWGMRAS